MRTALACALIVGAFSAAMPARPLVDELNPVGALPAQLVNKLDEVIGIVSPSNDRYILLDRSEHGVFSLTMSSRNLRRLVDIGFEPGRVLEPSALAVGSADVFAVLDAPNGLQRIQYFDVEGRRLGGFFLPIPSRATPRVTPDRSLSTRGAFAFTGKTFLVSEPAWGSLFMELDLTGKVLRHIGELRPTGHEAGPDLHLAFNVGLPIVDPTGGFYFVFQSGVPLLRKYNAAGELQFERHIEGAELDTLIQTLPNTWPARSDGSRPVPPSLVRTAATDSKGRLWVSLAMPITYVYGANGDKLRTVRFRGVNPISAQSLFFGKDDKLIVTPGGYVFEGGL
jgi:hypothetical protein